MVTANLGIILPAMWFQTADVAASMSRTNFLIMIFIGLIAISAVVQGIFIILFLGKAAKLATDAHASVNELKAKLLPLIHTATATVMSAQTILHETTPKIREVTDNLVATSHMVRNTSHRLNGTVLDANARSQKQVARVDGMVTAALTTTSEIMENINHGIRVPAQKIAAAAGQAKGAFNGLLAKAISMMPSGASSPRPRRSATRVDWES